MYYAAVLESRITNFARLLICLFVCLSCTVPNSKAKRRIKSRNVSVKLLILSQKFHRPDGQHQFCKICLHGADIFSVRILLLLHVAVRYRCCRRRRPKRTYFHARSTTCCKTGAPTSSTTSATRSHRLAVAWSSGGVGNTRPPRGATVASGSSLQRPHLQVSFDTSWLSGVTIRTLDLRSTGCGFDFRSCHYCYQVVTSWIGGSVYKQQKRQLSLPLLWDM